MKLSAMFVGAAVAHVSFTLPPRIDLSSRQHQAMGAALLFLALVLCQFDL